VGGDGRDDRSRLAVAGGDDGMDKEARERWVYRRLESISSRIGRGGGDLNATEQRKLQVSGQRENLADAERRRDESDSDPDLIHTSSCKQVVVV
jgi:hypothetical protein